MSIERIISGGQTGADRAGLEAGKILGLATGGTVPKGCRTHDGADPSLLTFGCVEDASSAYPPRTRANVRDSDGTVLFGNLYSPGTLMTKRLCNELGRPFIENPTIDEFRAWVEAKGIRTLNVAGNRERTNPGITRRVIEFLVEALP